MESQNTQKMKKADFLLWLQGHGKVKHLLCQLLFNTTSDAILVDVIAKFSCNAISKALYAVGMNVRLNPGHSHDEEAGEND